MSIENILKIAFGVKTVFAEAPEILEVREFSDGDIETDISAVTDEGAAAYQKLLNIITEMGELNLLDADVVISRMGEQFAKEEMEAIG